MVSITDEGDGTVMSVTNDAENAVTEIAKAAGYGMKDYRWIYRDSEGRIDEIIPMWSESDECDNVQFKSLALTNFKDIV
jgi:hypothetical protein